MQKILKIPTLIGIRRVVLEYSFENFTNMDKKKNGKVQNRTLPSFIKILYKQNAHDKQEVVPVHRGLCCYFSFAKISSAFICM